MIALTGNPSLTFAEAAAGDTITRSAGSWVADGFAVNDWVTVSGTASNNVFGKLAGVTATVLTFGTTDLKAEGPISNVTVTAERDPKVADGEGFGEDIWCTDSMHTGRLARSSAVVVQALYRRFITPQGTLRGISDDDEDLSYGFDVAAYVGAVGTDTAIAALPAQLRAQALKDDRIAEITFSVVRVDGEAGMATLIIDGAGTLVDDDEDFALTLAVTSVSVALLKGGTS